MPALTNFQLLKKQAIALNTPLSCMTLGVAVTPAFTSFEPVFAAESPTKAALNTALTSGGSVYFSCGSNTVNITLMSEKTIAANTTLDGITKGQFFVTSLKSVFPNLRLP